MLLRFSAANHLSIRDAQELSLVASSLKDREDGLIACDAVPGKRVLPAAVIYGANASGKTNVIDALRFMRRAVVFSHSQGQPETLIPRSTFRLDPACTDAPSMFELDFVVEGERYHYGFEALDNAFQSEWLYAFPRNRRQMLFERKAGEPIAFGRSLKGRNRVIEGLTRPNSLFLSAAAQSNHEQLSPVVSFFQDTEIETERSLSSGQMYERLSDDATNKKIMEFAARLRTGIVGSRRQDRKVVERLRVPFQKWKPYHYITSEDKEIATTLKFQISPPSSIIDRARSEGVSVSELWTRPVIELAHRDRDGNPVYFDVGEESAGTQRLLGILGRVYRALDKGTLIVIDELDASLHTQASEAVLALVLSAALNPKGAQLITTTHDTNLLRSKFLRRDQIWFTEKDEGGATHLYPLSDFSTRQGDNIEKGYLQGRFGAIPFAGSVADLFADG